MPSERISAKVTDDDQVVVLAVVLPDDQPVIGPVPDGNPPQAIPKGPAACRRIGRVSFQQVNRVIDAVQHCAALAFSSWAYAASGCSSNSTRAI
jgi:hypothetical protein